MPLGSGAAAQRGRRRAGRAPGCTARCRPSDPTSIRAAVVRALSRHGAAGRRGPHGGCDRRAQRAAGDAGGRDRAAPRPAIVAAWMRRSRRSSTPGWSPSSTHRCARSGPPDPEPYVRFVAPLRRARPRARVRRRRPAARPAGARPRRRGARLVARHARPLPGRRGGARSRRHAPRVDDGVDGAAPAATARSTWPVPTFNLIVDDDTAWRALARIRAHLEPDGLRADPAVHPEPDAADAHSVRPAPT